MGLFDKFKSVLGGGKTEAPEVVKGPSRVLREAGFDPSTLNCKVGGDGTLTVSGSCASGEERARIVETLEGMPNVKRVVNEINVAQPQPEPAPEPTPEAAPAPDSPETSGETDDAGRTYVVKSGDTLWKIAQEVYGKGSKYMKIFEANKDILDNPDKIFPGQELKIPDLED